MTDYYYEEFPPPEKKFLNQSLIRHDLLIFITRIMHGNEPQLYIVIWGGGIYYFTILKIRVMT